MKKLKLIVIIVLSSLVIVVAIAQLAQNIAHRNQSIPREPHVSLEERARQDPDMFPVIVHDLPSGFIRLTEARREFEDITTSWFWSTFYFIDDLEGFPLAQIYLRDCNSIIIYDSAYYINEELFAEIIERATAVVEQRNRNHAIGEPIEMRGRSREDSRFTQYNVVITSVTRIADSRTYELKFSIYPAVHEVDALAFFYRASTRMSIFPGWRRSNFVLIDNETVTIEVGLFERLDTIVLNIPRDLVLGNQQDITRTVSVHNN